MQICWMEPLQQWLSSLKTAAVTPTYTVQELQQEAQRARGRTEELVHACLCILTQSTNNRCTDFCTMEYRNNIYII